MFNFIRLVLVILFIGAISCDDSDEKELYEKQYENPQTEAEEYCADHFTEDCLQEEAWEECLAAHEECTLNMVITLSCPPQFGCEE